MKKPDIRIGIISDPHLGFTGHINPNYYGFQQKPFGKQHLWWKYALEYFKHRNVDVVVVPGDMANACAYFSKEITNEQCAVNEMKLTGDIFREVFKGEDTQLFCIYGNHDDLCQHREVINGGNENVWENAFHEPYSHVNVKTVKGFTFIGGHWGYEAEAKEVIRKYATENPDKPVFFVQHSAIKHTTYDSFHGVQLYDIGREMVKDFDNVIALTGHTHSPITDERAIWQSANPNDPKCTVIACGTFNYADSCGDLCRGENLWTKHAMILDVCKDNINVERLSMYTPEMVALAKEEKTEQDFDKCTVSCGADWNFTLKGKEMDFNKRSANAVAPEFGEEATAGLARNDTFVVVHFPAAKPLTCDNDMLHSYMVEAYEDATGELVSTNTICAEFHVNHTSDYYEPYYQIVISGLKPATNYTFKVYALDCWQKKSLNPIIHKGKTMAEHSNRLK